MRSQTPTPQNLRRPLVMVVMGIIWELFGNFGELSIFKPSAIFSFGEVWDTKYKRWRNFGSAKICRWKIFWIFGCDYETKI